MCPVSISPLMMTMFAASLENGLVNDDTFYFRHHFHHNHHFVFEVCQHYPFVVAASSRPPCRSNRKGLQICASNFVSCLCILQLLCIYSLALCVWCQFDVAKKVEENWFEQQQFEKIETRQQLDCAHRICLMMMMCATWMRKHELLHHGWDCHVCDKMLIGCEKRMLKKEKKKSMNITSFWGRTFVDMVMITGKRRESEREGDATVRVRMCVSPTELFIEDVTLSTSSKSKHPFESCLLCL